MSDGSLSILNTGKGDIVITFDNANAAETIRAKRMITDMLRSGYALLVKRDDDTYSRVDAFDEKTSEYIIADFDPSVRERRDSLSHELQQSLEVDLDVSKMAENTALPADYRERLEAAAAAAEEQPKKKRGRPRKETRVPMGEATAVAVHRSAGG
jgi:hypothetical protein